MAPDEVLVPVPDGAANESAAPASGGYVVTSLATVVQCDLLAWQAQRASGGLVQPAPARREVYYSVAHALGLGGDEWTPEEEARLDRHARLEQELRARFERLGAVSLEAALGRFFAPGLVAQFLASASEAERGRLAAWVTETRLLARAQRLDNPPGFLRSKIESGEQPPTTLE
ncbi:MAG: hypothetical protein KKA73_27515 [Chloroflexi bacterium]|nr:hypothetical protein [Chloroflexota bacterium]MBU1751445.1 hypothetical protein [Chloroflexota bacterium]